MSGNDKKPIPTYLDYLIDHEKTPIHLRHILVAMRNHDITFVPIIQYSSFFDCNLLADTSGFVVMISDDTSLCSMGPDHFDRPERVSLKQLIDKCSHIAVISSGIYSGLYYYMARLAGKHRIGTLIIETSTEYEVQWVERIRSISPHITISISTASPDNLANYARTHCLDVSPIFPVIH